MIKKTVLSMAFSLCALALSGQNPLINAPSLNHDGSKMAFNYQGDIWVSKADGSQAHRITIHEGNDTHPLWTSDGKSIVFQSDRYGNYDIFVMPAQGGKPKRLTYHSAQDYLTDINQNGEVLFATKRYISQVERDLEIQSINIEHGGTPSLKMMALGSDAVQSPDGNLIAFVRGTCRIEREAYKGAANRDIWVYDISNDSYEQITSFEGNDYMPQWGDNNKLYFLSSRNGRYNIHSIDVAKDGKKAGDFSQLTNHKDMGLFSYSISGDGQKIIAVKGDQTMLIDTRGNNVKNIDIQISTDYALDPVVHKTYSSKINEAVPSPNGKLSALIIRGELFITENDKEKNRTINLSKSGFRDRSPQWLSDDSILFVSDRAGQNDLYLVTSADTKESNLFKTLKHRIKRITQTDVAETRPLLSPNGKSLIYLKGRGQLVKASINKQGLLSNELVLLDGWGTPSGLSWSPDSQWIAYSLEDLEFNEEVYILKADGQSKPVNISMHPKSDSNPIWSADGSKIAFSSNRNNGDNDVWFTWLNIEDWQKTKEDWLEEEDKDEKSKEKSKDKPESKSKKKKGKSKIKPESKEKPITIDLEDIHIRQVQVTNLTGGEVVRAISKDGKTIYYTTGGAGRGNAKVERDLFKIKWDGKDKKRITKGNASPSQVHFDKDFKKLYYVSKGKLNRASAKDGKTESLPIKARMDIDYQVESEQIFEEAWQAINTGFYDPHFHGQDWDQLKEIYKPLAMKASTRADFKMMFNRMLGQINASHMGMYRGENRTDLQRETTGLLGTILEPQSNGFVKVKRSVYQMPADKKASKLESGDVITAVNGVTLNSKTNVYSLLNGTSNEKIYLNVKKTDGNTKEIVIRPKSSSRVENYKDWVKEKKRLTKLYSNDRLGYIHIQGMNWTSFEEFERMLTAEGLGKDGVVIDVRFNGGGWTTDYLMAVLNVRQHAYTIPRGASKDLNEEHTKFKNYYPYSERLPLSAWVKPSIALCNANSYSNAEIFSHAYKNLGIGTLVGVPTFGAVISTGAAGLIDGSIVRMPFRGWYVKKSERNMEFEPATPDIIVHNAPDAKLKGQDQQLKRAVDELLKQVGNK